MGVQFPEREPVAQPYFVDKILDRLGNGLLVLESDFSVYFATRPFCETFGLPLEDVEGRFVHELCDGRWDTPPVWRGLTEIEQSDGTREVAFEFSFEWPQGHQRAVQITGSPLSDRDRIFLEVREVTAERRRKVNQEALIGGLQHLVRNMLGNVHALAVASFCRSDTLEAFEAAFLQRLAALSRARDLLVRDGCDMASVDELVRAELAVHEPQFDGDVSVGGDPVRLDWREARAVSILLHELSTYSAKHGAFAWPSGRLEVNWKADRWGGQVHFLLEWRESCVPLARPPRAEGLDTELMKHNICRLLGGTVDVHYGSSGLVFSACFPLHRKPCVVPAALGDS